MVLNDECRIPTSEIQHSPFTIQHSEPEGRRVSATNPAESEHRFERLLSSFESARRRAAGLEAPLAHLHVPGGSDARLSIDLWDSDESGVPGLPPDEKHAAGRSWMLGPGGFAISPDGRFASHELGKSVAWIDRREQRIVGWIAGAASLTLHQRGKPLQVLLALWASDRGLVAVHAGLVARGGRGVLVPGRSGAGKSTVTLSCLLAGYDYIGDDWIGIGYATDGSVHGHGLYSSTSLAAAHAATHFPHLHAHATAPEDDSEKSLVLLHELFPDALASGATIRALALPRIVAGAAARPRRAAKSEALLALAPGTVFVLRPRAGRAGVERLAALVESVPAWWLEVGSDPTEIARNVDEILADL
jgi:hypothetical protein